MPYHFQCYIDGACRGNGYYGAYGGAGLHIPQLDNHLYRSINSDENPTNQRAELTALIMALEAGLRRKTQLRRRPYFQFFIATDSMYVINCLTKWHEKWTQNGWINSKGLPVANRDLIQRALYLHDRIVNEGQGGHITFEHVWREENEEADRLANLGCDKAY